MLTAKMSKMMIIGMLLSMLALVAAWPLSAQGPSGLAGFGTAAEREQLEIVANQLAASGYTLDANAGQATAVAVAPRRFP